MINQVNMLADMLVKRPVFFSPPKEKAYGLFLGVPVKCLTVQGSEECAKFGNYILDLLICRGREAVLAVVFDAEYRDMKELFSTYLQELPNLCVEWDGRTAEFAEEICGEVETELDRCQNHHRQSGCFLPFILASSVISRVEGHGAQGRGMLRQYLRKKHLVGRDGTVTAYGGTCGLFLHRFRTKGAYMTTPSAEEALKGALVWNGDYMADDSLPQRLQRMKQGRPAGRDSCRHAVSAVKQLLNTPLEQLFANHPTERQQLSDCLSLAEEISRYDPPTAHVDKAHIRTYGDVIYAVRNLREYAGICTGRDNRPALDACQGILANLSVPLLESPNVPEQLNDGRSLRNRLGRTQPGQSGLRVCTIPLSHYCYGAAELEQSAYPLWLYRCRIRFYLSFSEPPTKNWNLRIALQYAESLRQAEEKGETTVYFPLIYDLLVESVSGAVNSSD